MLLSVKYLSRIETYYLGGSSESERNYWEKVNGSVWSANLNEFLNGRKISFTA